MSKVLIGQGSGYRDWEYRNDATGVVEAWVHELILTAAEQNAETLRQRAQAALAANATYLAIASPTNANVVQQVDRLTKQSSALIRILLQQFDDISGT